MIDLDLIAAIEGDTEISKRDYYALLQEAINVG